MAHFVYIIYSSSKDRFYVGETLEPKERLGQHNSGFYKNSSTEIAIDWKLKEKQQIVDDLLERFCE